MPSKCKTTHLLEHDHATAGRGHLSAEVLQTEPLPGADAEGGSRRAGQPAVVHSSFQASVLALPLSLLSLGLLQLPAELQHQRFGDHFSRSPSGRLVILLVPTEPGGHGLVLLSRPEPEVWMSGCDLLTN